MKVEAWGYDYWLASETSHLNESQILILIKLGIKNVTIAFDNDVKYTDILKNVSELRRYTNVFAVRDVKGLLGKKSEKLSPCDKGREYGKPYTITGRRCNTISENRFIIDTMHGPFSRLN